MGEYKRVYVGGFGIGNINTDGIENGLEIHSVEDVNGASPDECVGLVECGNIFGTESIKFTCGEFVFAALEIERHNNGIRSKSPVRFNNESAGVGCGVGVFACVIARIRFRGGRGSVGVFFVVLACCHAKCGSKQKNGQHDCDHSIDFFHNDIPFGFVLLIAVSFPKKQIGTA